MIKQEEKKIQTFKKENKKLKQGKISWKDKEKIKWNNR
jgi:hypothetical protein